MPLSRSVSGLALGLLASACASEAPSAPSEEQARSYSVVAVDRNDPASSDSPGSASAVARFISLPAFAPTGRALQAAGAALGLPAVDTCQGSDAPDLEPPPATQDPVELMEAGDVAIDAAGTVTPLVPHAFPSVGTFASGVLYATRDRASSALPAGVTYAVTTSGSPQLGPIRLVSEAPQVPSQITVSSVALKDVTDVHTMRPIELSWQPGTPGDIVYAELLAYDGSPSVVCAFRDDTGTGSVAADTFTGTGGGRLAVHRLRVQQFDPGSPKSELRFDFQVGTPVEYSK